MYNYTHTRISLLLLFSLFEPNGLAGVHYACEYRVPIVDKQWQNVKINSSDQPSRHSLIARH